MKGAPRSAQFDDIYFSAENGLEETQHVFLQGNNLPQAWEGKDSFVIAETGFGTGLNFLSAWKLFEETANADQQLHFISVEKFPLTPEEIHSALEPWADYFGNRVDELLNLYPLRVAGFHRLKINEQVTLTLIFDDINNALPRLDAFVDCWFLDGFTPAKNPDMWSDLLFKGMARLSVLSASYATFTAAGDVRRGLEAVGFSVEKKKGFGRKRDMIAGHYKGEPKKTGSSLSRGSTVAIIGGGLAGTACAYMLKQYGFNPVIYEASDSLASGASGNEIGLYNPRYCAQRDFSSEFFAPAYAQFIQFARNAGEDIGYKQCGSLQLINSPDKERRLRAVAEKWLWHSDHARIVSPSEASDIAGIDIKNECLYLPDAGSVLPDKLCHYYAQDVDVHLNSKISDLDNLDADAIVIANSFSAREFEELAWLPLEIVRGQVTKIESSPALSNLKCNIHYGGYVSATNDGVNMIGATFTKWIEHCDVLEEDHAENLSKMKEAMPNLSIEDIQILSGRASMRTTTNDRFPVIGQVPNTRNMYVSAAFGSHGIIGSLVAARYIVDLIQNHCFSLPSDTAKALSPQRFLDRAHKKGRILLGSMI